MKLDFSGCEFIKKFEELRLKAYQDQRGKWTIGWGHTDGVDRWTPIINEAQAESFFREDVSMCERIVSMTVKIELTQSEFNALVSFSFNEGVGKFHTSTLLKKLNSGDKRGAAKEFDRWIYYLDVNTGEWKVSNGLVERRRVERELFLSDLQISLAAVRS